MKELIILQESQVTLERKVKEKIESNQERA